MIWGIYMHIIRVVYLYQGGKVNANGLIQICNSKLQLLKQEKKIGTFPAGSL